MKNKVLLICIGNDLRGDDGWGKKVGEEASKLIFVDAIFCVQLTPEIAESVVKYNVVIFVDAKIGDNIGAVDLVEIKSQDALAPKIGHHQSPEFILAGLFCPVGLAPRFYCANFFH